LRLADINHDGALDLVLALQSGVRVHVGDGKGGFAPVGAAFERTSQTLAIEILDLNHDGRWDLVAEESGSIRVFLQH
jgi:hypothetical protein